MHASPSSERAPLPGRPIAELKSSTHENTQTASGLQAQSLRRRFALSYFIATAIAPLIWGLPR